MMADNLNQGAAYIMGSDKVSVNDAQGSDKLYREGLEFTTYVNPDELTQEDLDELLNPGAKIVTLKKKEDKNDKDPK